MIASALLALSLAYWGPNHADMHEDVLERGQPFNFFRQGRELRTMNSYLQRVLYINDGLYHVIEGVQFQEAALNPGTDTPDDAPNSSRSIRRWVMWGGVWEDGFNNPDEATKWGGLRAVNHFHDPLAAEGGYSGIRTASGITVPALPVKTGRPYVDLMRSGKSVTTWVMGTGGLLDTNRWGYPTVLKGLKKFFTDTDPKKRPVGLAVAMRAIGQVMHLVQDNTVPDHARDLAHPGNGWEEYLRDHPAYFKNAPQPWRVLPLQRIEEDGLRALWDRDQYSGVTPAPTVSAPVGIDEFVQANFLAWNRFYAGKALFDVDSAFDPPIDFTTVPRIEGVGYENYPWPKLTAPVGSEYGTASPALPLQPCIAIEGGLLRGNYIDERCWKSYELPLMKIAHGYSQTVLTLAFPQGRAELVPADGKDLRNWKLRVWNLGRDEDKVTWHVDSVKLMPILPPSLGASKAAVEVQGVTGDIAPTLGDPWESPPFALDVPQQAALNFQSHVVVVLEGNLGTNKKTPFVYGLPIPNGLPLAMQATTHVVPSAKDRTAFSTQDCCNPMQCTSCGETTDLRQPLVQAVHGTLKMVPTEVDLLGEKANDVVKGALRNDARIAGVAVVAWTTFMQPYHSPLQPPSTQLKINDPRFSCTGAVCLRKADAPDTADIELDYDFQLTLSETMDPMNPPSATDSVFLMVWTTAGAIVEWPVLLWPQYMKDDAEKIVADNGGQCGHSLGRGLPGAETVGGCYSGARMPSCGNATHVDWTRNIVMGPIIGLAAKFADKDFFLLPGLPRVLLLAGLAPSSTSGTTCAPPMTSLGNTNVVCVSNQNSFAIRATVNMDVAGPCGAIPPKPTMNYTAKYETSVSPESMGFYLKLFGQRSFPKWVTDLD